VYSVNQIQIVGVLRYCHTFALRALPEQRWLVLLSLLLLILARPASAAEPTKEKNVLFLSSFSDRNVDVSGAVKSALRARAPWPVNFYVEYLETWRFDKQGYEESLVQSLRNTYSGVKVDLILVYAYPALQFALRHRDELFPNAPIVFMSVDISRLGEATRPGVTGVAINTDIESTLGLALRLHPRTTTVAVITNNSDFERYWLLAVHNVLFRHRDKLREIDLVALPPSELLEKIAGLPPQTVVLFQQAPQDSIQPTMGAYDVLGAVSKRLPTYCIFSVLCLNHGGIGGNGTETDEVFASTAELAQRVLSGERPDDISVVRIATSQIRVDWRQLRHWHIPESALPPGSVILYREPSFWERDRNYIIAAVVVILVQALSIIGLLLQRERKRKAEAVLCESEERFRVMADTTPSLVWMCDPKGEITYLNDRRVAFTGPDPAVDYRDSWTTYVHPDDLRGVLEKLSTALKDRHAFSCEYRLRRHDGAYRWMFDVAAPRVNGDGSFAGFIGSAIDITDQKLAQEALENVSGKLIEAQEKERSRIARDLHDDICQRLALLSMEVEQANRNGAPPSTKKHLAEIRQHCSEIAGDVQSLSHELHSSKLEYLGIVAAIKGFCKEFAKQHQADIEFHDHSVSADLPKDVSLCLFRVTQEALHNAMKYSGSRQVTVTLTGTANEVQLVVKDAGAGFDVEQAKREQGLGLVSMQERVHLVRGHFHVESHIGAGAKVVAVIPVAPATAEPAIGRQASHAAGMGAA
jgi:PAS domain S-box-containing protein